MRRVELYAKCGTAKLMPVQYKTVYTLNLLEDVETQLKLKD